jgi:hypothetical protein
MTPTDKKGDGTRRLQIQTSAAESGRSIVIGTGKLYAKHETMAISAVSSLGGIGAKASESGVLGGEKRAKVGKSRGK